ncbi:MAG: cyclopropane fatty acyl phospholipid synthase [Desulfobulbaceae bacterium]|nr:cyclopropane fatty acyl phospholipid synthase [Desulfobulbaceae bacterium]
MLDIEKTPRRRRRNTPSSLARKVEQILSYADITIGGDDPWDIRVHNNNFYPRLMANGSLGLGESYMEGWWDCDSLDQFFYKILNAELDSKVKAYREMFDILKSKLINYQKVSRAFDIGRQHYDIGNNLYQHMLDKRMLYSCGYWKDAKTLDEAQEAKLDLIFRKLDLQPGMKVLDIGCGWGGAARFAAERYGVEVVGITVSKEQLKLGKEKCKGLPVDLRLQDYRGLKEKFDRIFSIGMFEHVGYKNYCSYFKVAKKCLKKNGLFLLHTIGNNRTVTKTDPWINCYIFPHSLIPSAKQISAAFETIFVLEDWHNFGADYDKTLMAWYRNFNARWDDIRENYDETFYRMWKYYLLSCAGSFRARKNQLWQIVLSDRGVPDVYQSAR